MISSVKRQRAEDDANECTQSSILFKTEARRFPRMTANLYFEKLNASKSLDSLEDGVGQVPAVAGRDVTIGADEVRLEGLDSDAVRRATLAKPVEADCRIAEEKAHLTDDDFLFSPKQNRAQKVFHLLLPNVQKL